jgi:transcription initiation factor TFIIB
MPASDIYARGFDEDVQADDNQCPECGGRVATNVVETVCEDCGLVIDEQRIDHGPEWRSCNADEKQRTGGPVTVARHDRGLSTEIGEHTDASGNTLSGRKRRQLARLRREQSRGRFQSKAERNLAHGLGEVRRISSALGHSATLRDQACQLFRSAQNENLLQGRSIEGIAAASVYGACRCTGRSQTLDDVAVPARVAQSRVKNAYQTLNAELGLPAKPVQPSAFVPGLASELACPDEVRRQAQTLAERAEAAGVTDGVHPAGFAAACLYEALRERGRHPLKTRVAEAADVCVSTVRTHQQTVRKLER